MEERQSDANTGEDEGKATTTTEERRGEGGHDHEGGRWQLGGM
jgi:hypothetical protein